MKENYPKSKNITANNKSTALYCDAVVLGETIPLIVDSRFLVNVHRESKRALGKISDFLFTVSGVEIPIDVVITDTNFYKEDDLEENDENDDEYESEELEDRIYNYSGVKDEDYSAESSDVKLSVTNLGEEIVLAPSLSRGSEPHPVQTSSYFSSSVIDPIVL
ncbi:gag-pol fusion protein [Gigaspora margarita]|uniref:Gag-pol fusion protein n=1 Tax=Gigaspora margarita TaxID=4874 RepID=A0A8H4AWK2_GIGMA|nr:gag-pol fusion protein [Gigaspora margarita]